MVHVALDTALLLDRERERERERERGRERVREGERQTDRDREIERERYIAFEVCAELGRKGFERERDQSSKHHDKNDNAVVNKEGEEDTKKKTTVQTPFQEMKGRGQDLYAKPSAI